MRRRDFIALLGGTAAWPLTARAQQSGMPVIGFFVDGPPSEGPHQAFLRGMAELGYVEGKNFATEYRLNLNPDSMPQAAADLVRRNVNAIFAATPAAVAAVSKATTTIPVVAIDLDSDPVAKGYVQSIARPGSNITGMFLDIPELCGKQLELLKEIVPRLTRIAVFGIAGLNAPQFAATETAVLIGELALAKRLPLISLFGEFPRNGGLIAYGPNVGEMFRRCGKYVGKVLHGARPSELYREGS